jgi:hypothetical protein
MKALKQGILKSVQNRLAQDMSGLVGASQKNNALLKQSVEAVSSVRREMQRVKTLLQKNQQLITSLYKSTTTSPSAAQRLVRRDKMFGAERLKSIAKRYVGGRLVEKEGLLATGTRLIKSKVLKAGAQYLKKAGISKGLRRTILQAGGRAVGQAATGMGTRLLAAGPKTPQQGLSMAGIAALTGLLLPKDIKEIVGTVIENVLRGIGLDEEWAKTIMAPFRAMSDVAERVKNVGKGVAKTLFTEEGRQKAKEAIVETPGVAGSSMESETGATAPYEAPDSTTPDKGAIKTSHDKARKELTDTSKKVDESVTLYQRLEKESLPSNTSSEQKTDFKEKIGRLVDVQTKIKDQLKKQPSSKGYDFEIEKNNIANLAKTAEQNIGDLRQTFKMLTGTGGQRVEAPVPQQGMESYPQTAGGAPVSMDQTPMGGEGTQQAAGGAPVSMDQTPMGGESTGQMMDQTPMGGEISPPSPTPSASLQPTLMTQPVAEEPTTGMDIMQRSVNVAQQYYTPKQPDISTNVIDNSRSTSEGYEDTDLSYIPSPVASRSDLDVDIVFTSVA